MTEIPSTMQAVVATSSGPRWAERREFDVPIPKPGEVLVRVHAFSINRGELALLRSRDDGWRPGQDLAGVVVALGPGVDGPPVGTRVVALVDQHGWAQYAVVEAHRLAALPDEIDDAGRAAALPLAGITALNVVRRGGALLGRRVLVTGASGGVGQLVVQLARAAEAAVVAIASEEHAARLHALGAATVASQVEATRGPFALVCEGVGGPSLAAGVERLTEDGVAVLYGATASEPAPLSLFSFAAAPAARLEPFYSARYAPRNGEDLATLVALLADGRLQIELGFTGDWDELDDALDALAARRFTGKAVLSVSHDRARRAPATATSGDRRPTSRTA
jgi:NADPH:quinone reductase-like Zn-dependent oxidoreductase